MIRQLTILALLVTVYEHDAEDFARTYQPPHNWYYDYSAHSYELHLGVLKAFRQFSLPYRSKTNANPQVPYQ